MIMMHAIVIILLNAIGCFSLPSDRVVEMEKTEGICYLRSKVMCTKKVQLQVMIGNNGDTVTDTVIVDGVGDATIECLPLPCSRDGEVSGEVAIVGNDIMTKPDFVMDAVAYTSKEICMSDDQKDHFEVACEGDQKKPASVQSYQNYYDQRLRVECPNQQAFFRVRSVHSNQHEDRRWQWLCRRLSTTNFVYSYWSFYVNAFDQPVLFGCRANYFLCGVDSYHSNSAEDRRWRFKCCYSNRLSSSDCELSTYLSSYDRLMDFNLGYYHPRAITGVYSYHSNHHEDRRWRFSYCRIKFC